MAHVLDDRVKETTTTTGTGNLTLGGAVSNFQTFANAPMVNNDTTLYVIQHLTAAEWEVGVGTWLTGGLLARTTILGSSNANAVVNLSAGTKYVGMTLTPNGRWPGLTFTGPLTPFTNDLAALGSASLSWADLFLASNAVINWNNGETTFRQNSTNQLIIFGAELITAVGTTTYPPLRLQLGSLMTTPSVGAVEADATNLYGTTDAGNRGYLPLRHLIRADAGRTYTSNVLSQSIFNVPTNGRLTLETGTYMFEGVFSWGSMSATSGNRSIEMLGAGTATIGNWMWIATGWDGATATAGAGSSTHMITASSPASVITAQVGTSLVVYIRGSFECSVAGTLIPSTTMVTAAASVLTIGSFLEIWRVGDTARTFVGQWD